MHGIYLKPFSYFQENSHACASTFSYGPTFRIFAKPSAPHSNASPASIHIHTYAGYANFTSVNFVLRASQGPVELISNFAR